MGISQTMLFQMTLQSEPIQRKKFLWNLLQKGGYLSESILKETLRIELIPRA